MARGAIHADKGDVAFRHRSSLKLMTMCNGKTPKGEKAGWLSAILYLSPHTSAGGPTLCPYSTDDCRRMCLAGSGLSGLPKAMGAKLRRTRLLQDDPRAFIELILGDVERLAKIAEVEGMKPVVRLNGTSDVIWEKHFPIIFRMFPEVRFMDYTKIPLEFRHPPLNYHLTFSHGDGEAARSVDYLREGHSVAAVVDVDQKDALLHGHGRIGPFKCIDGDEHDLRHTDPPGSIVLLRPKGHVVTGLLRPDLAGELLRAMER